MPQGGSETMEAPPSGRTKKSTTDLYSKATTFYEPDANCSATRMPDLWRIRTDDEGSMNQ